MEHCCRPAPPLRGIFPRNFAVRKGFSFTGCTPGFREASLRGSDSDGVHRLNGVIVTTTRRRNFFSAVSGLQWESMLRRRSSFVDDVVLPFLSHKSRCLKRPPWQQLRVYGCHREREKLSLSSYWNPGTLHVKEGVYRSAGAVELGCQRANECHETAEVRTGIGRAILRGFLLALACACLFSSREAYAVDAGILRLPSVPQQSKDAFGLFSPKLIQVLGVVRDQGVLLSILLGLSAFFSMAETSITTLWPWKVRELAEKEKEGGVFQMLRQDVARFLTTILIGTTVVNIAATALVTDAATTLFGEAGITAATGVMTVVILLLTEITPKSIAVHNATEVARVVMRPVALLSHILYPVGRIVTAISMGLLKILGLKSSSEPFVTEEELKLMLRGAELSGSIEEEEQDMIEKVLEIKDTHVREVMTPLVDVVAIDSSATLMDFRNLWVTHQYSRVPVFERRVDNIVGIAYAMDMLDYVEQVDLLQRLTVGRITHKPAYFVPDSMSVWNLLREFRVRKVHIAIVLNEYGGAVGVVTLEDVVEEIVGEIFDENDSKEEIRRKTGYLVQRADGIFDVDANTSIEDLTEALGLKVPPEGPYHYETVSGFVCEAFGYIPRTGETTTVILQKADDEGSDHKEGDPDNQMERKEKFQNFGLEILAGNARKVASVRFERLGGSELQIDGEKVTRIVPHLLTPPAWDGEQGPEQKTDNAGERICLVWDSYEESDEQLVTDDEEDTSVSDKDVAKNHYLIAENIDVDNMSDSDVVVTSEQTSIGDQESDVNTEGKNHNCALESDHVEMNKPTVAGTLDKKWDKHKGTAERRHQRRKPSSETAIELGKHRKVYVKQKEAVMGMRQHRKQDEQSEQK